MLSAIPTKLITLPTYVSSSSKTPQPPQLKFQPPSSISLPLLTTLKSPCTPTFPYSPTQIVHPLCPVPPPTSRHHLVPHPPSKALPATPSPSSCVAQGLLIHLFLTLLISKTPGSDSRHFLTGSIFWIFNLIENKYITEATILGCSVKSALKQVWIILRVYSIIVGWHKLVRWPNYPKKKCHAMEAFNYWEIISFFI